MNDHEKTARVVALNHVRTAAALLREYAQDATPAPWWVHDDGADVWAGDQDAIRRVDAGGVDELEADTLMGRANSLTHGDLRHRPDGDLIAALDPAAAVAVADLLAAEAERWSPSEPARRLAALILGKS